MKEGQYWWSTDISRHRIIGRHGDAATGVCDPVSFCGTRLNVHRFSPDELMGSLDHTIIVGSYYLLLFPDFKGANVFCLLFYQYY